GTLSLRVDRVQGALRVPGVPGTLRLLQGDLMTDATVRARKRAEFHPLAVSAVRRLTEDSIEVAFQVPEELAGHYDYLPGQYLALRRHFDDRELRRSYSICAMPAPGEVRVAIKRDLGGEFSTWANDALKPGDVLDVMSPQGTFTTELGTGKHFAAIVAGSGITPIMSLAKSALAADPDS